MPSPHLAVWNLDGTPADPITISFSAGEDSAIYQREIWNDKDDDFVDTTTAQGIALVLLASVAGGAYVSDGVPLLDERWTRLRITAFLTATGETTDGVTGTLPFGTNAEVFIPDLAPQQGVRIELQVFAPGTGGASATRIKIGFDGNRASAPLSRFTGLALGSAVIPADRIIGLRRILRGSEVTADDTDTVAVANGQQVYDGTITTFPAEEVVFDLEDGDAVDLAAGQSYRVTLSRTGAGVLTVTKGPKATLTYPATPANEIFLRSLTVTSADGIAVAVAPGSVVGSSPSHEFAVRAAAGLAVTVAPGEGLTGSDLRQYLTHDVDVGMTASSVNRVWRLDDGTPVATLTDVAPSATADLLALVTTDVTNVTGIVDARRFAHRAVMEWSLTLAILEPLSQIAEPSPGLALAILDFDGELEAVEMNLTAADVTWTAGAVQIDLRTFAPGAAVPFPAGGAGVGGVSIYTSSGTDDRRPSIAWDAASLRVWSEDHEVRRFVRGTRFVLDIITTVDAPAPEPEQEIRVTLHFRRYR